MTSGKVVGIVSCQMKGVKEGWMKNWLRKLHFNLTDTGIVFILMLIVKNKEQELPNNQQIKTLLIKSLYNTFGISLQ